MNAPKVKYALCINTAELSSELRNADIGTRQIVPIPADFYEIDAFLTNRAMCETDESLQQLLPYAVLVNAEGKVFVYERGGAGNEARLHAKLSIGLGGHVDTPPLVVGTLEEHLQAECAREIKEEIDVLVDSDDIKLTHLIRDTTNAVGRVHLGIVAIVPILRHEQIQLEEGHIENGRWMAPNELRFMENYDRLESWSQAIVSSDLLDSLM